MPKKGENIYKRKDGRWEGRYIRYYDENGKAKYGYVYSKTYNEVKKKLIEKKSQVGTKCETLSNKTILYNDVLNAWLQSAKINIKESTYSRYFHLIDTHIRPYLGKYPLSKISTQIVEGFIEKQLNYGLGIDITDIKNCYLKAENPIALLRGNKTLFQYGIHNGSIISYTE